MTTLTAYRRFAGLALLCAGFIFLPAGCGGGGGGGSDDPPPPPRELVDWRGEILYFALTDRFANGNPANDNGDGQRAGDQADPDNPLGWHGGDFAGLTGKIQEGYFRSLGVTALWISPVVRQVPAIVAGSGPNMGRLFTGYHGYWGDDFYAIEPHFGTLAELQTLADTAHQAGLKLVLDMVVNHAGYDTRLLVEQPSWLRSGSACGDNRFNQCLAGLPDFRQSVDAAHDYLLGAVNVWLDNSGADGIRMDTMKHVPDEFWVDYFAPGAPADPADVFTVGEVFDYDIGLLAHYLNDLDSPAVFDFPLQGAITDALARGGSLTAVTGVFDQDGRYADPTRLATFVDNHDLPRFLSQALAAGYDEATARARLDLALSLLYTARGIPTLYYGTEIAMRGVGDPFDAPPGLSNREDMDFTRLDDSTLDERLADLAAARRSFPALSHGSQSLLHRPDGADVMAFTRQRPGAASVVVVLNNEDAPLDLGSLPGGGITVDGLLAQGAPVEITGRDHGLTVSGGRLQGMLPAHTLLALTP